jgi:type II secretory pathway component GspD/PulD (secretin)
MGVAAFSSASAQATLKLDVDPLHNKVVSAKIENADVRAVLAALFKSFNKTVTIAPEVAGKVSADLNGLSFESSLIQLLGSVKASFIHEDGQYRIFPTLPSNHGPEKYVAPAPHLGMQILGINYDAVDTHQALRILFRMVHGTYVLAPNIGGFVTLHVRDLSPEAALDSICSQVHLKWRLEDNIFYISKA